MVVRQCKGGARNTSNDTRNVSYSWRGKKALLWSLRRIYGMLPRELLNATVKISPTWQLQTSGWRSDFDTMSVFSRSTAGYSNKLITSLSATRHWNLSTRYEVGLSETYNKILRRVIDAYRELNVCIWMQCACKFSWNNYCGDSDFRSLSERSRAEVLAEPKNFVKLLQRIFYHKLQIPASLILNIYINLFVDICTIKNSKPYLSCRFFSVVKRHLK